MNGGWRHTRVTLSPLNPEHKPIVLTPESEGDVQNVAKFLAVLGQSWCVRTPLLSCAVSVYPRLSVSRKIRGPIYEIAY